MFDKKLTHLIFLVILQCGDSFCSLFVKGRLLSDLNNDFFFFSLSNLILMTCVTSGRCTLDLTPCISDLANFPKNPSKGKPFPGCLLPLYQNESVYETIHMQMRFTYVHFPANQTHFHN